MNYILRTALIYCVIISSAFADKLEIKMDGKSVQLPSWTAQKEQYGAVVLVNGGEKARWSTLLESLAKKLNQDGWSTVLLNCNNDSTLAWNKALPEVVSTLRQQKNKRIIVLHYGEQLKQTFELFNKSPNATIEGLILLSAYDLQKPDDKKIELIVPVFDLAGQFDYQPVLLQFDSRQQMFGQKKYLAMQVPGAHHDYEYSHQLLLSFMHGWMLKLAEFKVIPPPVLVSYIESIEPLMPKQVAFDNDSDWAGFVDNPQEPTQEIEAP